MKILAVALRGLPPVLAFFPGGLPPLPASEDSSLAFRVHFPGPVSEMAAKLVRRQTAEANDDPTLRWSDVGVSRLASGCPHGRSLRERLGQDPVLCCVQHRETPARLGP